jgi:hypothetical protein
MRDVQSAEEEQKKGQKKVSEKIKRGLCEFSWTQAE